MAESSLQESRRRDKASISNELASIVVGQTYMYVTRCLPVLSVFIVLSATEPWGKMARPITLVKLEIPAIPYDIMANSILSG